jgi:hypothetical protein
LSQWLGTDLDYNKIQNMLLGKAIDLTKENIVESVLTKPIDWMLFQMTTKNHSFGFGYF